MHLSWIEIIDNLDGTGSFESDHSVQLVTKVLSELDRSALQSAGFVDDAYWNFRLISDCTLWLLTSFPYSKPFQNLKATLKTFFSICFWLVAGNYPQIYKRKTFQRCKQRFWYGPQIFTCSRQGLLAVILEEYLRTWYGNSLITVCSSF